MSNELLPTYKLRDLIFLIRSTQEDSGISSPIQRSHETKFLAKQKWAVKDQGK